MKDIRDVGKFSPEILWKQTQKECDRIRFLNYENCFACLAYKHCYLGWYGNVTRCNTRRKCCIFVKLNEILLYSQVQCNVTIPSQEASECLFSSSSDLKLDFERKLDLVQLIDFRNPNI